MSSTFLRDGRNILHKNNIAYDKYFTVNNKRRETLAEFVKRTRLEKKLTLEQVAARSGGDINNGYLSRIENGIALNPSPAKIKALAKGLKIPEEELFAVVAGKPVDEVVIQDSFLKSILVDFENLTLPQKLYFRPYIEMMRIGIDKLIESGAGKNNFTLLNSPEPEVSDMEVVKLLREKTGENISIKAVEFYRQYKNEGIEKLLALPPHVQEIMAAYYEGRLDEYLQARKDGTG